MILSYKLFEEKKIKPYLEDLVVCVGNIDDLKTHNHIGYLFDLGVEFINRFSDKLHNLGGSIKTNNGWYIRDASWVKTYHDNENSDHLPIFYSRAFRDILSFNLRFLIDYEKIYYSDVSFIDVTSRNDTISCISKTNFDKLEDKREAWTSPMRQNIRVGRFIKKIVPDDNDKLIEDYTNEYKFSFGLNKDDFGRFKVCKGLDMAKWYLERNYATGGGSLHASCMKHIRSQFRLPIYTDNPDKVKMVIIKNPQEKLLGRALIWKLDEPAGRIYMDRVYSAEDYVDKLFLDYAKKKGYLTKFDVDKNDIEMKVYLKKNYGPPQHNPYMDTFKFFVRGDNFLTNKFKNYRGDEYYEYVDHD